MPESHAPPRRRRSDFDRNRKRLLDAARRLLAEHGPESLTVSEVAHQAGLNRTTAYQHFRTRDELVGAVLEQMAEEFETGLDQPRSAAELIDGMTRVFSERREIARLALHLLLSGDPLPKRGWERFVARLARFARGARAQSGVDAEMLAHILVGTWLVWALRAPSEYDDVPAATARLAREMKRLFLYGLFRPEEMPDLVESLRPARARKK
ncbi:MAG TPA: helix-turn-helix domain-containing protein, partial [Myxococcota bacterium]|nr:helix-turn-helix domain-containing protein [Myxococcota bacterium]